MLKIDGSQGEGGGQVLRTTLTLAILTGQPVHIFNIRARRRNPGLAPQHVASVLACERICRAEVHGAQVGSTEVQFSPGGPPLAGEYVFDVSEMSGRGSAGAVTLLLQAILLPLAMAQGTSHLILRGGTHVAWSPPGHYVADVLLPTLERVGVQAKMELTAWGWYPRGGGEVRVEVHGNATLRGIDLTKRGDFITLSGVAVASNLPSHIPQRIASRANNLLTQAELPGEVSPLRVGGASTGAGVFLTLEYQNARAGFSALGERGKPSEQVAAEAVQALLDYVHSDGALDPHLPDQLLPALVLAQGQSAMTTVCITQHTITNAAIVRNFIRREIRIEGQEGAPGTIYVEGEAPHA